MMRCTYSILAGLLIAFVLLPPAAFSRASAGSTSRIIRAHLLSADKVTVAASGSDLLVMDGDKKLKSLKHGATFTLKDGSLYADKDRIDADSVLLKPEKDRDYMLVNGKPYHGVMELKKRTPTSFIVVNDVNIEEYLAGVLSGEVIASWPDDALKAQAVAARTYILYKKKQPRDKDFDVYSTVMDQVYAGMTAEMPKLKKIVQDTEGQVLTYSGEVIKAYYHSTCGGHTEDGAEVFPEDASFLAGVPCNYCSGSPMFNWNQELTTDDLRKALTKLGNNSNLPHGELLDLKVTRTGKSGRAADITLILSDGERVIKGSDLRMLVGPGKLKSTRFKLEMLDVKRESLPPVITTQWVKRLPATQITDSSMDSDSLGFTSFGPLKVAEQGALEPPIEPLVMPQELFSSILLCQPDVLVIKMEEGREKVSARLRFTGSGWGHGVGMCQWGACRMAQLGNDYRAILKYYYPGTSLVHMPK
jgi:stage II sporulation protein D